MRILLAYSSEPHYMAPPRLSEDQVDCGPYFQDRRMRDRWTSLATLRGDYDLAKVARRLPAAQQPDLIVVHVDGASMAGTPRNLGAFKCPKILLVADTHHGGRNPIAGMIRYALSEPFDRVVLLYDRHHADFFRAAGIQNLHWLPSLTFAHSDARVAAAAANATGREARIAIVGTTGYHPRRLRLFSGLVENKLPLDWRELHQSQAIEHYAGSLIGLNASMNGDLNMRTFEILAGGALLLTDRLAPASGLGHLLRENHEFVAYDSLAELVARARHLIAHPDEARAIADAGATWFREHFNEHRRREAFLDVALDGRDRPEFTLPSARIHFPATPSLGRLADGYHWLQVRHQKTESVRIVLDDTVPTAFAELFATLPRVQTAGWANASGEPADLAVVSVKTAIPTGKARHLWFWDAPENGAVHPTLTRLAAQGWRPLPALPFLFTHEADKPKEPADILIEKAREHLKQGDVSGALENASSALKLAPASVDALFVIVELAIETQNWPLATGMLAKAHKLSPRHPQQALLRRQIDLKAPPRQAHRLLAVARLAYDWRDYARAQLYAGLALEADAECADAHHLLGLLEFYHAGAAASAADRAEAVARLRKAVALAPRRADYQLELALACDELRWLHEAADAYRIALQLEPSARVWRLLGHCLSSLDSPAEAADAFRHALALAPDDDALAAELNEAASADSHSTADNVVSAVVGEPDADDVLPPALAGVSAILERPAVSEVETSLALCAAFESVAVQSSGALPLPALRSLMAYQPWFGIDTPTVLRECLERGRLVALFGEKTTPDWTAPDGIRGDNFRDLSHHGINLWLVARHRVAIALRKPTERIDPAIADDQAALSGYYGHAIALIDKARAYFDCYRPESVMIAQGHDIVSAVLRHFAILRGLRVVALENTFRKDRLLWDDVSGISVNRNLARNHYWRHRDFVSDDTARCSVDAYLAGIKSAKSGEHASPDAVLSDAADSIRTVTYIGQVGTDSSVLFGLRRFASQADLIATLADIAAEKSWRLLIKLHPKENPAFIDEMTTVRGLTAEALAAHPGFQSARARLGDHLVLDADNRYDTYDLIRRADVCVTVNSQAGLEAAIHGREVVLCGDAFYGSLGFTHEATDTASLRFILDRVLGEGLRHNDGPDARAFFHIYTELYCLPKTAGSLLTLFQGHPSLSVPAAPAEEARAPFVSQDSLPA